MKEASGMHTKDAAEDRTAGWPLRSVEEFLAESRRRLRPAWLQALPRSEHPGIERYLCALMRDYPLRSGKGLRPALMQLACLICGGDAARVVPSALALELFQNFALVHDDIEDGSQYRRGRPTLHRLWGTPLALNAGDALFAAAFRVLQGHRQRLPSALAWEVQDRFLSMTQRTLEGQALELGWIRERIIPSRAAFFQMLSLKTGWYSGRAPCQIGALLAEAPPATVEALGRFGMALGIGFQLRDDWLNLKPAAVPSSKPRAPVLPLASPLASSSETVASNDAPPPASIYGKEYGGDVAEGKRTLIVIALLERLDAERGEELRRILQLPAAQTTAANIDWVVAQAEAQGVFATVDATCHEYAHRAEAELEHLPAGALRELLREFVAYLTLARER